MTDWTIHECVSWVRYRLVAGVYQVEDTREQYPPLRVELDLHGVHRFAADHSATGEFVPVGNWMQWLTSTLGIPTCGACEKRRACLNQLLGKPW